MWGQNGSKLVTIQYVWLCIYTGEITSRHPLFASNSMFQLVGLCFKKNVCGSINVISSMHKCLPSWVLIKAHWHQRSNSILRWLYGWRCNCRWIGSLKTKELMSCYLEESELASKNWYNGQQNFMVSVSRERTFCTSI